MESKMGEDKPYQKKIKVFILLGQSNMLGMGTVKGAQKDGTLEHAVKTKNLYQYLVDDNGDWKKVVDPCVRNFFTMGSGNDSGNVTTNELLTVQNSRIIGPEIGIGCVVGQWLASESCRSLEIGENGGDKESDDIFLLKSCIGNRSLGWDLLPPGSPSFEYTDESSGKKWEYAGYKESPSRWEAGTDPIPNDSWYAGKQYDGDISRAKDVLADLPTYIPGTTSTTPYEVAGFFYWQGDKDRYDKAYAMRYKHNLIQLIRQLRVEFSSPNAKFVLATLGQTSKDSEDPKQGADRLIFNAQMEVPTLSEFVGNVACVYSKPFCHGGASNSHYNHNAETYMDVGLEMGRAMVSLLEPSDAPSSTPTVTVTNAPTAPPVDFPTDPPTPGPTSPPTSQPTMGPTSTPTKTPTKNPTEEPVVEPTLSPINGEPIPTDSPEEEISETFNELRMGMAGVTNLTADARLAWEELTGDFATSFVFNDLKDDVSNFETSFKVTNVEPFEEGRRHQRMMRGESEPSRGLQETQQEVIIVVYIQTVKYNTIDASRFTPDMMVTGPFATTDERSAYVTLLKSSSNPELSQIKGVSEIQVPVQTAAPTAAPIVEAFALSTPVIIGIACGGAGFLILVILFCIYCRSGSSDGSDAKSSEDPPLHVDVRADEVSTLAGPDGPPTYGDRSVATVDYDYSKAYGGAGDTSVSSAGGTFGSNTQNISFPNNAAATGAALGAMDENSYDAQYDNPGIRNGDEEIIHIFAPPGKLGVVIDTPDDGAPVVHAVKDTSVIADRIVVGDKLVAVDDEDVRSMTAIKVSKMISRKGANPSRKLTIVRSAAQ